jgi:hypothetical protein
MRCLRFSDRQVFEDVAVANQLRVAIEEEQDSNECASGPGQSCNFRRFRPAAANHRGTPLFAAHRRKREQVTASGR